MRAGKTKLRLNSHNKDEIRPYDINCKVKWVFIISFYAQTNIRHQKQEGNKKDLERKKKKK